MKNLLLLTLIVIFNLPQQTKLINLPGDNFVTGWKKKGKLQHFKRDELFNHIDGGAELFLEFGFEELVVQRYGDGKHEIVVEIYRMESPVAALGIYLMKCGKEQRVSAIKARNTGNRYQFTIVKNSYFIQINSFSGIESLKPVMIALAQQILASIPPDVNISIFKNLPQNNLISGSERIIRGPYALQPIYTFGRGDILLLGGKNYGVVGDYKDGSTAIVILYPDKKSARAAFTNLMENLDPYLKIKERSENGFKFIDYNHKYGTAELEDQKLILKIKKPN